MSAERRPAPPFALLAAVAALGPTAMNLFVPSVPGLATYFDTDTGAVQLTLTLYMATLAIGQLVLGPLADRFGRRPVMIAGLWLSAVAAVICALAPNLPVLIAGRMLQALGGCAGIVLARVMARDLYGGDAAASAIATLTMVMAIAPALSPAVGGYLDVWFGWRAGFVALGLVGGLLAAISLRHLHETRPGTASTGFNPEHLLRGLADLLRSRVYVGYALHTVCTMAAWFGIIAGLPLVMANFLERPPNEYGLWFTTLAGGYIAGNFVTARIAVRVGLARLVNAGALVAVAGITVLFLVAWFDRITALTLFGPIMVMSFGHGLSQSSAMAGALGANPAFAGTASGLMGFAQMAFGAGAAQWLGVTGGFEIWPLIAVVWGFSFASWLAYLVTGGAPTTAARVVAGGAGNGEPRPPSS